MRVAHFSQDGGLPRFDSGSASATVVSRPARRSLTFRPADSRGRLATLSIEGFGGFVASSTAPIATGWSDNCQAGLTPAENQTPFHGARQ